MQSPSTRALDIENSVNSNTGECQEQTSKSSVSAQRSFERTSTKAFTESSPLTALNKALSTPIGSTISEETSATSIQDCIANALDSAALPPLLQSFAAELEGRHALFDFVQKVVGDYGNQTTPGATSNMPCFDVAVFHQNQWPVASYGKAKKTDWTKTIWNNLEMYEATIQDMLNKSKGRHPKLIVFPEDGIYTLDFMYAMDEALISQYCIASELLKVGSYQSQKQTKSNSPKKIHIGAEIMKFLGDLAIRYEMFIIASVSENKQGWPFNTALAFSPMQGKLVACYRKEHLFDDEVNYVYSGWDFPTKASGSAYLKDAVFSLPLDDNCEVKVGLVICADLMFRTPLHTLKEEFGVTHIAAPVMWYDHTTPTLPQFQAVSWATGLVLMVSNQLGKDGTEGTSGIFCDYETLGSWRSTEGTLIASVPVSPSVFRTKVGRTVAMGDEPPIVSSHVAVFVPQYGTIQMDRLYPYIAGSNDIIHAEKEDNHMEVNATTHPALGELWHVRDQQPRFRIDISGGWKTQFDTEDSGVSGSMTCIYDFYFTKRDIEESQKLLGIGAEVGNEVAMDITNMLKRIVKELFQRKIVDGVIDGVRMQECILQPVTQCINEVEDFKYNIVNLPSLIEITLKDDTRRASSHDVVLPLLGPQTGNQPFSKRDFELSAKYDTICWNIKNHHKKLLKAILRVIPTAKDGRFYVA